MNLWISKHLWRVWLAAVAAIWSVAFAWPRAAPQTAPLVHPRERWSLPSLPEQRDLTPKAVALVASPLWGTVATASTATAAAEDNRWVLAGVYVRNGEAHAVVRYVAKRGEQLLAVGEKIPSGEKIVEIGSDAIWVADRHGRRRLPIYSLAPGQP